jgi:hypothetical protein
MFVSEIAVLESTTDSVGNVMTKYVWWPVDSTPLMAVQRHSLSS